MVDPRPGSARTEKSGVKRRPQEWTPWHDKIRSHRDAVIFVEECFDHSPSIESPQVAVGSRCLLSASADGAVRLWQLAREGSQPVSRQKLALTPPASAGPKGWGACTALAYDGLMPPEAAWAASIGQEPRGGPSTIFAGYESGQVASWDAATGGLVAELLGHEGAVTTLRSCGRPAFLTGEVLSAGDEAANLISAAYDGTVRVWNVQGADAACLFILEFGKRNPVADLALLPRNRLVACSWDGRLRSLDLTRRSCTNIAEASSTRLLALCCAYCEQAPDDDPLVFVGHDECGIACWLFPAVVLGHGSCREIAAWKAHDASVTALRFLQTSTFERLISGGEDRLIKLWTLSGQLLEEFYGHTGGILSMVVATKDRMLWTGSRDHSVRSWNLLEAEARCRERAAMTHADAESLEDEKTERAAARARRKKEVKARPKSRGRGLRR